MQSRKLHDFYFCPLLSYVPRRQQEKFVVSLLLINFEQVRVFSMLFKLVKTSFPALYKDQYIDSHQHIVFLYMIGTVLLKTNVVSFYPIVKVPSLELFSHTKFTAKFSPGGISISIFFSKFVLRSSGKRISNAKGVLDVSFTIFI